MNVIREINDIKQFLSVIQPLLPVLTKLADNPEMIEKLADDAGAVAKDVAALSAAVADNKTQVGALMSSVGEIAALKSRIDALEAASHTSSDERQKPREPIRPQGWPGDDNLPAGGGGPNLDAGSES